MASTWGQVDDLGTFQQINDMIAGSAFTCPADCTSVTSMGFYVNYLDAGTWPCKCAIYTTAGVLVGNSDVVDVTSTGAKTVTCSTPIAVTPSTSYILVAWTDTIGVDKYFAISRDNTTANARRSVGSAYNGFPANLNLGTNTGICCVSAIYTPTATGQPTIRRFGSCKDSTQYKRRGVRCF